MSIYTTSTVDHPSYKKLVCGRANELEKLVTHIAQGKSIAVFGEKRIGKTSLLYLLRDIINREINIYQEELLDLHLRNSIPFLQNRVINGKAIYLSLQSLTTIEVKTFISLLRQNIKSSDSLSLSDPLAGESLSDLLNELNRTINVDGRLIILIDEVEVLLEMPENRQFFRNLRSSIQAHSRICFVLSGAELWHKQIKEKTIDLVNNVELLPIKRAELYAVEKFLVRQPIQPFISTPKDCEEVIQSIIDLTKCKPLYVQEICDTVTTIIIQNGNLPRKWRTSVTQQVQESLGPALDNFYSDPNLDQVSKQILALLANKPKLTARQIARKLGYSLKSTRDKLTDLETLDKVYKYSNQNILFAIIFGKRYRVTGAIIEDWGKKNQELPTLKKPWVIYAKWITALFFLSIALVVYIYTHPSATTYSCTFPNGTIYIAMPSSLEASESGKVQIATLNQGSEIASLIITLNSDGIEYQKDASNRVKIEKIATSEKRISELNFNVRAARLDEKIVSQVLVQREGEKAVSSCSNLEITMRSFPIKNNWILISSLLVALSGFWEHVILLGRIIH
jgi:AAA domain/Winged helix-turn-helix DNA-binding